MGDVANLVEVDYEQLTRNQVLSYARQGGVHHTGEGVHYEYRDFDFDDTDSVRELLAVPAATRPPRNHWSDVGWLTRHYVGRFLLHRNYVRAREFARGKFRQLRQGRLGLKRFWWS